jgi:hypothetical protein
VLVGVEVFLAVTGRIVDVVLRHVVAGHLVVGSDEFLATFGWIVVIVFLALMLMLAMVVILG